jgi:hypothetical protein
MNEAVENMFDELNDLYQAEQQRRNNYNHHHQLNRKVQDDFKAGSACTVYTCYLCTIGTGFFCCRLDNCQGSCKVGPTNSKQADIPAWKLIFTPTIFLK